MIDKWLITSIANVTFKISFSFKFFFCNYFFVALCSYGAKTITVDKTFKIKDAVFLALILENHFYYK